MSWYNKLIPSGILSSSSSERKGVPEGVWSKCGACDAILFRSELEKNLNVCPKCDHHIRMSGRERLRHFLDEQDRIEIASDVEATDWLKFKDSKRYKDRISAAQKKNR